MRQIAYFYLPVITDLHLSLNFFGNVYECIREIDDPNFQPVLQSFQTAMTAYNDAARPPSNNLLTMQIATEDVCRDLALQAIRDRKDELLADEDPNARETGRKIGAVLDEADAEAAKNMTPATPDSKGVWIETLLNELSAKIPHPDRIPTGITDCIAELNRANWSFSELNKARNDEIEGKILTAAIMNTRREMDRTYNETITFINAMLIYNGDERYADIIDRVNIIVEEASRPAPPMR
ncbi:MAG: DUF6261 family protein [Tannerellaceae bacterium]|jgi:hypothetical protein|nr:DUF6261 family protein [Tannerellaceae bacterium]